MARTIIVMFVSATVVVRMRCAATNMLLLLLLLGCHRRLRTVQIEFVLGLYVARFVLMFILVTQCVEMMHGPLLVLAWPRRAGRRGRRRQAADRRGASSRRC
jgi:hypothetical protein